MTIDENKEFLAILKLEQDFLSLTFDSKKRVNKFNNKNLHSTVIFFGL